MSGTIKQEEHVPLANFLKTSFVRDRAEIQETFSEFTTDYLAAFEAQIEAVDLLDKNYSLTEEQKAITTELYEKASALDKHLNKLSYYLKRCALDTKAVSDLKKMLKSRNIEGACEKMKDVAPFLEHHVTALSAKGMPTDYATFLREKRTEFLQLNTSQNEKINNRKTRTSTNNLAYVELYKYVSNIAEAGKIVYDKTVKRDEYVLNNVIARMRRWYGEGGSPEGPAPTEE